VTSDACVHVLEKEKEEEKEEEEDEEETGRGMSQINDCQKVEK